MVDYAISCRFVFRNGAPVAYASVKAFNSYSFTDIHNPLNPFDDTVTPVRDTLGDFQTNDNGWISGIVSPDAANGLRLSFEITKDGVTAGPFVPPWPMLTVPAPAIDCVFDTGWPGGQTRCLNHQDPNPLARTGRLAARLAAFSVQLMPTLPGSTAVFPTPIVIMRPLPAILPEPLDNLTVLPALPTPEYLGARRDHAMAFTDAAEQAKGDPPDDFNTREDYGLMYDLLPESQPKPQSIGLLGSRVMPDDVFAYQRIAGANPMTIARVGSADAPSVPAGFNLPEADVIAMTGLRLDELQTAHRLYVCDYSRIAPLLEPFAHKERYAATAVALFFYGRRRTNAAAVNAGALTGADLREVRRHDRPYAPIGKGPTRKFMGAVAGPSPGMSLQPLAIMVIEKDGSTRTVLPGAGEEWEKAKLIVQMVDTNIHELEMHLWNCHFAMEPVVLSMIRQLDDMHPLRELLIRHSYGLLWINNKGVVTLVERNGGEGHRLLMLEYEGMARVMSMAQGRWTWRSTQIKTDIARRGMGRDEAIIDYPYRDDGVRVFDAIRRYTGDYVDAYYDSDEEVRRDSELALWLQEMATLGVTLLPTVVTRAALADFLADYIFQVSALHAAINAPQWNYNAYTLDAPGYLRSVDVHGDLMPMYPTKDDAIDMMALMGRLATFHWEAGLGHYRKWLFNPLDQDSLFRFPDARAEAAAERFRNDLADLDDQIKRDNRERYPYEYLMPSAMDNSTHT